MQILVYEWWLGLMTLEAFSKPTNSMIQWHLMVCESAAPGAKPFHPQVLLCEGLQGTFMVKHQHPTSPLLKTTPSSFFWLKLSVVCLHRQDVTGEKWSWHCWVLAGWEPDWAEWALCSWAHNSPRNGPVQPQRGEASEMTNSLLFNSATNKMLLVFFSSNIYNRPLFLPSITPKNLSFFIFFSLLTSIFYNVSNLIYPIPSLIGYIPLLAELRYFPVWLIQEAQAHKQQIWKYQKSHDFNHDNF